MQKLLTTTLLLLLSAAGFSQIKGKITDTQGAPIPFVSVTIENTYTGTTANEEGQYELPAKSAGKYTLLFQSIGFKTKRVPVSAQSFPYVQNVTLEDESYQLAEVTISNTEDPAYEIIRQAIAHKKENSAKTGRFEADFYSKGIFRLKNVPKKILGVKVDAPAGMLDSTGSGIVYLSETVSHITFEQPNKLKERIVASKISGNDNGFSYNTAMGTFYNFYDNYIDFGQKMISPLASNAFNYYRYKLEGSYFDENNRHIFRIKVLPRRDKEPVFEGHIFIVDQSWAIAAIDLDIKGYRVQQPIMENLNLQQNFSYNTTNGIWAKNSQTFDFTAGMMGIGITGKFTHVYSNYIFHDAFDKKTFGKEIVFVEENSNKKDSTYWNTTRPVPLTTEEIKDYTKKDSLQLVEKSPVYMDSVMKKHNRFHIGDIVSGYSYKDLYHNMTYSYDGIIKIPYYNTVQGWNMTSGVSASYYNKDNNKYWRIGADFNYGLAEDRLRVVGKFNSRFKNAGSLSVSGGSSVEQFNPGEPIGPLLNMLSTLLFKDNYMKLYDKTFAKATYGTNVFTGLYMSGELEYSRRKALYNNTDYVLIRDDKDYTSNNPLEPYNYTSAPFPTHHLMKGSLLANVRFGQKYITRPDGKIPVSEENYPALSLQYTKGFAGSESRYEYDMIAGRVTYNETLGNKGDFGINIKGGKFFGGDGISFADYKHFNGNQTHVGTTDRYLNVFNMLPYYSHSTNDSYFELHAEHNFKGYIMNKVPLLDALQWNLVVGYHALATPDYKPYMEFTAGFDNIGFGKFHMLRVDYVRSVQGSTATNGVVFGLKFLGLLD